MVGILVKSLAVRCEVKTCLYELAPILTLITQSCIELS